MSIGGQFPLNPWSFITKPYTIEDVMEDSLGLNTFFTSDTELSCMNQIDDAIRKGAKKFIINLQDRNCTEYAMVLSRYPFLWKDIKIVIQFDQEFAQKFTSALIEQQLLEAIKRLGVGKIDCIKFPADVAGHCYLSNTIIYENLARMGLVQRAIIPK